MSFLVLIVRLAVFVVIQCGVSAALVGSSATELKRLRPDSLVLKPPPELEGKVPVAKMAPEIDFAVFPGQWEGAKLWSSWGDALAASNGKFYASLGDHGAPRGTACVYEIDPLARTIRKVVDFNETVQVPTGNYTPGKIHGPIVEGTDGWLYFVGYRGSERMTTDEFGYKGDSLVRYHPATGRSENLDVLVPFSSVPVLAFFPPSTLYGLSVPGANMPDARKQFFQYNLAERRVVFTAELQIDGGPRAFVVAGDGKVFYGEKDKDGRGHFSRFDPKDRSVRRLSVGIPGDGVLRAASVPDRNGIAYCISKDGVVFAFDPQAETVRVMTESFVSGPLYTAVCALDVTGRHLYYIPAAHGGSGRNGTPIVQLDTRTAERKVIAFLNEYLRETEAFNAGGTFGIALSSDGSKLFVSWNGAKLPLGKQSEFGVCAATIIHIPQTERVASVKTDDWRPANGASAPPGSFAFQFRDISEETGLIQTAEKIRGHAAGWGDVDGDGQLDLYVGTFHTGGSKPNFLLRNRDGRFELDTTDALRISSRPTAALFADLDNDGDLDLYVSSMPASHNSNLARREGHPLAGCSLFRNNGDGKFTNISAKNGACPEAFGGRSATVLDFDGDGLLDLLVGEDPVPGYNGSQTASSRLFRNVGELQFEDVTRKSGIPAGIPGLGVAAADVNNDGWPDLFIASARGGNRLFVNDRQGSFFEPSGTRELFEWKSAGGDNMICGVCFGDVNGDGLLDIVIGQHYERPWVEPVANRLYLNRGIKSGIPEFEDVTERAGLLPLPMKAPHIEIQDFDNDGRPDIYTSIVMFSGMKPVPVIFRNLGTRNGIPQFQSEALEMTDFPTRQDRAIRSSGAFFEEMIRDRRVFYSAAAPSADVDRDGRLDLFMASWWLELPSLLLRNETPGGHWIDVEVVGAGNARVNRMGIGSRIEIYRAGCLGDASALIGLQEISTGYGYGSCQPAVAHFGLGSEELCDLRIILPHGRGTLTRSKLEANQRVTIRSGSI